MRLKKYPAAIAGRDFVDFCLFIRVATTRFDAGIIGRGLVTAGLLEPFNSAARQGAGADGSPAPWRDEDHAFYRVTDSVSAAVSTSDPPGSLQAALDPAHWSVVAGGAGTLEEAEQLRDASHARALARRAARMRLARDASDGARALREAQLRAAAAAAPAAAAAASAAPIAAAAPAAAAAAAPGHDGDGTALQDHGARPAVIRRMSRAIDAAAAAAAAAAGSSSGPLRNASVDAAVGSPTSLPSSAAAGGDVHHHHSASSRVGRRGTHRRPHDAAAGAESEDAEAAREAVAAKLRAELAAREASLEEEERALRTTLVRAGFLTKQGHRILSWRRRWFQLQGQTLSYFVSPRDAKPKGVVELGDFLLEKAEHPHAGRTLRLCNTQVADRSKDFVIFADTPQDFVQWVKAIDRVKRSIEALRQKRAALESDRLDLDDAIGQARSVLQQRRRSSGRLL
ncbi:hypothetical protein FNF27_05680 [Cafeteria roenbergensis]|uniref:PH domain-containing protein n=1 Tax=Cafeteria roenbergensis TaxID=33653 RepID=A0A5A8E5U4_CAFRO|nr:hypothetical protein FNF29_01652 [Cafeteria roenbergensis]KAA0172819.1 hypothetical protein FNF27_05680 [Cafeteria roenbergensis]|eukprot:KAA0155737.1 hypothetical protein FNF29_01652 [Cafeteria roenbergensis]